MILNAWMKERGHGLQCLALNLNVSTSTAYRLATHKSAPDDVRLAQIVGLTEGDVSWPDYFPATREALSKLDSCVRAA